MAVEEYVTKKDLETQLKLHRNTVSRLLADGRFPNAFRIAGRWRIPLADVQLFIAERRDGEVSR